MGDGEREEGATPLVPVDVLSVLGHELRGHLGVARGYLRLLSQAGDLGERQARAVAEASRAADRLAELLDEMAEYGRWARGEVTLRDSPVALGPMLSEAARGVSRLPALTAPRRLTVTGDAGLLLRAFTAVTTAAERALDDRDVLAIVAASEPTCNDICVTMLPASVAGATLQERSPDLRRSGLGLRLALADVIFRAHGGRLTDLWNGERWIGCRARVRHRQRRALTVSRSRGA